MPIRKHQGIVQTGGKKGKLKKGYKYSGKKLKSGLPQIVKVKKSKNKKSKKGGRALATGSYGCIFSPVVKKCDPSKDYSGKVSKLALEADTNGCPELNMGLLLNSYDREFKHFLGVTEMCKVNPRNEFNNAKITNADIAKCPDLMIDNKLHDNLIMPSAKIGLDTIFQPNSNIDFGISADMIGKIIMKTCQSCIILRNNGIAHFDLKNQNMMFKWTNQPEMESFLIDFGKEFMPASWREFDQQFIGGFNPMTYIWAPEIWLQFGLFGKFEPELINIKNKLKQKKIDAVDSWLQQYDSKLRIDGTPGWKKFIDKAMVYQMINGIFYWISSPDFNPHKAYYFVPHLNKNGIRFNKKIEKIFVDNSGLRDLFIEMLTINPNNRPTLEQVQNKLVNLGFNKKVWKFEPNDETNW